MENMKAVEHSETGVSVKRHSANDSVEEISSGSIALRWKKRATKYFRFYCPDNIIGNFSIGLILSEVKARLYFRKLQSNILNSCFSLEKFTAVAKKDETRK